MPELEGIMFHRVLFSTKLPDRAVDVKNNAPDTEIWDALASKPSDEGVTALSLTLAALALESAAVAADS